MSIEINEMVVQMSLDETGEDRSGFDSKQLASELKSMKKQMISDCRDLFYELQDELKER